MAKRLTYKNLDDKMIKDIKARRVNGETIESICNSVGISTSTLYNWSKRNEKLAEALEDAEELSSKRVVLTATAALVERLKTREVKEISITETRDSNGRLLKTQTTTKTRTVEPDSNLITCALQRMLPKLWDQLAVQRLDQGTDESSDYGELIDSIIYKAKNGGLK